MVDEKIWKRSTGVMNLIEEIRGTPKKAKTCVYVSFCAKFTEIQQNFQ